MSAFASSPFSSSPHRDVLEAAVPVDGVSQLVLLNELKNRGRAAVLASQYPDAVALYEKALHVTQDSKEKSVLEANLSLCHQKMSHWSAALETAERSTQHDPSYVKGWWRLGQAQAGLSNFAQAVSAMEKACQLEPNNKAIRKEYEKFQKLQSSNPSASGAPIPPSSSSESAPVKAPTPLDKPVVKSKPSSPPPKAKDSNVSGAQPADGAADEDGFSASDVVRGYKVVNGKKTSYFHNELSSDAAKLIGDIAPKKLDAVEDSGSVAANEGAGDSTAIGSAWNKAGTWEERDVTKWALETLEQRLGACQHSWDSWRATVSKCDVKGHASVAMVRGKKRYIYEFEVQVDWDVRPSADEASIPLASGKLCFPEIDGTCSGVYEATASVSSLVAPWDRTEVDRNVCKKGLRDDIHHSLNTWIEQLKETY
jgi:tetratricopeptide (TPR) repeat protein